MPDNSKEDKKIILHFGHNEYPVSVEKMSGSELRRLFGVPPSDDLFRAQGTKVKGGPIGDDEIVDLEEDRHFVSAPKQVNFGGR
jgi:hypothetical protein